MCDQDHFEKDRQEYEALGLVTRKQFGIILGAGMAMMLPQVANAVAVTESDVNVMTPDGTADCYFAHPASGTAPGVLVWPDIFGLRPAFRQMGGLLGAGGESVLPRQESPDRGRRRRNPDPAVVTARASSERDDAHD
jgi:carboxymethylenebutenolidase